jgi:hypothetical protein
MLRLLGVGMTADIEVSWCSIVATRRQAVALLGVVWWIEVIVAKGLFPILNGRPFVLNVVVAGS